MSSHQTRTVASIVGARPQFIKSAPVSRALTSHFKEVLIHTGQHYDYGMSEIFFKEMEIRPPDFNLGIGGGGHSEQTGRMLIELEKVFNQVADRLRSGLRGYQLHPGGRAGRGQSRDSAGACGGGSAIL